MLHTLAIKEKLLASQTFAQKDGKICEKIEIQSGCSLFFVSPMGLCGETNPLVWNPQADNLTL